MEDQALQSILKELQELRLLYQTIVDKIVPLDKADPDEEAAIASEDDYASEDELFKALG